MRVREELSRSLLDFWLFLSNHYEFGESSAFCLPLASSLLGRLLKLSVPLFCHL